MVKKASSGKRFLLREMGAPLAGGILVEPTANEELSAFQGVETKDPSAMAASIEYVTHDSSIQTKM